MLFASELFMKKLNLPQYEFRIREENNTFFIFDKLRKKELVLTPEEWVRQNLIQYLIADLNYPAGLVSVEAGLKVNTLQKRYDALVYSRNGKPLVLIECKAPEVPVNQKVFEQILAYNSTISAPYLLISNGLKHFFLGSDQNNKFKFMDRLLKYDELI